MGMFSFSAFAEKYDDGSTQAENATAVSDDYFTYYSNCYLKSKPDVMKNIDISNFLQADNSQKAIQNIEGFSSMVIDSENSTVTWGFDVETAGNYSVCLDYCALGNTQRNVSMQIMIDSKFPYSELKSIVLSRTWADETLISGSKTALDKYGNELRPKQSAVCEFSEYWLSSSTGMYDEPYLLYLEPGKHTITLKVLQESFAVKNIKIGNQSSAKSYSDYVKQYKDKKSASGGTIRLEAENAYRKNSNLLYPVYDRNSAATLPSDPLHIKLNSIGQSNWSSVCQKITWKANVETAGLYHIAFRVKQNLNQTMNSYRTLRINGEIPFAEAKDIAFPYNTDWYVKTLGNGNEEYYVYLEPGDEISLEITAGPLSEVLRNLNQSVLQLNEIYRKIIIITGTDPDIYRDYSLDKQIPDLIDNLNKLCKKLNSVYADMTKVLGKEGTQASSINEMTLLIQQLVDKPFSIPEKISSFKGDIENLGSLILSLDQQPLELDCIAFVTDTGKVLKPDSGLISQITYQIKQFIGSFLVDYNEIDTESSKSTIKVWVTTGRDQAQILSNMIDDSFTSNTGVKVNLSMVDTGATLIQATLAGKGPDVALMVPAATPINLAMRGALVDLSQEKFGLNSEFKKQFYDSAWTPFYYNNGTYAMPETQVFDMLFYRTDIFNELGLEPPNTWDDFYQVTKVLQNNNLEVGIPEIDGANPGVSLGISTFDKLLFQKDGTYYNFDLSKTLFDTPEAYNAFEEWVQLYQKYGLSRSFDFFNRFRTGEMPMGIVTYSQYNQLEQAAPEIRGLWNIAPIPGTLKDNGNINRAESSNGTGCIMLKSAENKGIEKQAFQFMSWWVSSDSQQRFASELEGSLGTIARYTPANREAFETLNWNAAQSSVLKEQWQWVVNVNQIPGNYYITRELTNALRSAIDGQNPTRTLSSYNKSINEEIERKRQEFTISTEKGK